MITAVIPHFNNVKSCVSVIDDLLMCSQISEIIVIDDCSTDEIDDLLDLKSITVLQNSQNSGPGKCRNTALAIVNTKWVMFIDSDDRVDVNALNAVHLDDNIKLHVFPIILRGKTIQFGMKSSLFNMLIKGSYGTPPWNKIYDTDFLRSNNIYFGEGRCFEDHVFSLSLLFIPKSKIELHSCPINVISENPHSLSRLYKSTMLQDWKLAISDCRSIQSNILWRFAIELNLIKATLFKVIYFRQVKFVLCLA